MRRLCWFGAIVRNRVWDSLLSIGTLLLPTIGYGFGLDFECPDRFPQQSRRESPHLPSKRLLPAPLASKRGMPFFIGGICGRIKKIHRHPVMGRGHIYESFVNGRGNRPSHCCHTRPPLCFAFVLLCCFLLCCFILCCSYLVILKSLLRMTNLSNFTHTSRLFSGSSHQESSRILIQNPSRFFTFYVIFRHIRTILDTGIVI